MNRADRKRWAETRTLADVGELTALWLEGQIPSQPGYAPGCGPDPETADLIPVLAACNRAGFITSTSQPGMEESDGWVQRAAVQGFASPAVTDRLRLARDGTGLLIYVQEASRRMSWKRASPVSLANGQPFTRFGTQLSRRFIRDDWEGYGICGSKAVAALCAAWQVTLVDPEWGRNDRLWPALERFAARQEAGAS